jgi:hypothetical protein
LLSPSRANPGSDDPKSFIFYIFVSQKEQRKSNSKIAEMTEIRTGHCERKLHCGRNEASSGNECQADSNQKARLIALTLLKLAHR